MDTRMDLGNMAMQSTYTCFNWTEIKDHTLATLTTHNGIQNRKNCLFYKRIDKTNVYSLYPISVCIVNINVKKVWERKI